MAAQGLPWTAKDVFVLSPAERLLYNSVIRFCRSTGIWRYPVRASGDLETMTTLDKIYWLYKAQYPIERPAPGSGLEKLFAEHIDWTLPSGFLPMTTAGLSAVGDLMDHPYLARSATHLYEQVADLILGSDVSMANLECVVRTADVGAFRISPKDGAPLSYSPEHFDAVNGHMSSKYSFMAAACNHSLDFGEEGVRSTSRALASEGIAFDGIHVSEETVGTVPILDVRGIRIGILSHTFGTNGRRPPAGKPWIVNRTNLNAEVADVDLSGIQRQLEFCRRHHVDTVVAQLHWGMEHELFPRPDQVAVAHRLAELGADIVIGHHPHVIQPMEAYRTSRDPDRVVPIFYSLGNLITPFLHPIFRRSAVARIDVVKGRTREGATRAYVRDVSASPVVLEVDQAARRLQLGPAVN